MSMLAFASTVQNPSSLMSLWSLINQLQMLMLLLLTKIYLPLDVENIIIGNKVALIPFDYIPFKSFSISDIINKIFGFEQIDNNIYEIGLESGSTFINTFSLLCSLAAIIFSHFIINLIVCFSKNWKTNGRDAKWMKYPMIILDRILKMLTFSYYIRTLLESIQSLLISSFSEIYNFRSNSNAKTISLIWAVFAFIWWISSLFISFFYPSQLRMKKENQAY